MSWTLAYAHDQSGNRIAGEERVLIAAVLDGQPVRVLMDSGDQQYVTDAQCLWVKNNNVYAQNTTHVSVEFTGNVLRFQDDSYWWMIIVDTQGNRDMIRWLVGEHKPRGHTQDRVAMKWFVG